MTNLATLTLDELADGICSRAGRIAAAHAELLLWVGEFDRREGWAGPGMLSCAHWLSWRIGLSLGTARDQVRVARRLPDLPQIATAFAAGQLSYSKVRAISRVAEPDDGIDWLALARSSSGAQLDQLVRGISRARAYEAAQADPERAAWRLRTRVRYDTDGSFIMTIRGPAELLPVIQAGLDAKKAQLRQEAAQDAASKAAADATADAAAHVEAASEAGASTDPGTPAHAGTATTAAPADPEHERPAADRTAEAAAGPDDETAAPAGAQDERAARAEAAPDDDDPPAPTDADALLALAQDALQTEHASRPDSARRRRWQLTAHVDPRSGWARQSDGELLPPSSLTAVLKTLPGRGGVLRLRRLTAADLRRFDLGRASREPSDALRQLLSAVDGEHCRFPGCTRRRKLHAHHVRYWSDGGATDLANLVLLCSRHHTVVHAERFTLQLHPDRRLDVRTSTGTPVPHTPAPPEPDPSPLTCGPDVSAEALRPDHTDPRLDLRYAVAVLMSQAA